LLNDSKKIAKKVKNDKKKAHYLLIAAQKKDYRKTIKKIKRKPALAGSLS
jgi:hypothetical protein